MRIPASLHIAAGVALLFLVVLTVSVEGKRAERKEDVKKEVESNSQVQQKSPIFSFIRRLFPNPEKTLETLKAVAATAKPRAKSMKFDRSKSDLKDSKSKKKGKKEQFVPVKKSGKPAAVGTSRLRLIPTTSTTTAKPKKISQRKTTVTTKLTSTTSTRTPKPKSGKFIKDRLRTAGTPTSLITPPAAKDMEVLTHGQKRDRLRQELVKETEDNCLAKILCGSGSGKPKPKDKNTFVSDTAYLIKEFFNIFDFTADKIGDSQQSSDSKKTESSDTPQNDEDEDEEEEEDDADDEEDEIYRKEQEETDASKKKYTTGKPKSPKPQQQTSQQPIQAHKTRTSKPMAAFMEEVELPPLTKKPNPIQTTTTKKTTTTTSTTTKGTTSTTTSKPHKDHGYLSGGDMAPMMPSKIYNLNKHKNRVGEAVTLSSNNFLTSSMITTSVSGSATLKPLDMSFEIPLKNAKDNSDGDDDEEDDNNKYTDDERYDDNDDSSTYHRVTLEELVGDIKLTAADLAMLRRGRSMKLNVNNITSDRYIKSKLRQMKQVNNEVTKLRIAQKIGRSMREPRQCRQFSQIAQEVLQTCPLTTEVIRFFNTNLKNGSSIEVKRTPPSSANSTGGLVLLSEGTDGANQAYLVDNSPPSSNINFEKDLKNPSVPSTYGKDENIYPVYEKRPNPNPQNANLNQHGQDITKRPAPPKDEKEADSEEEQDDEDDDGDSDEDEEDEARNDDTADDDDGDTAEDEEDNYEENSAEDEEDGSDDDSNNKTKKVQGNHEQIQGEDTNQPNVKVVFRPQAPKRPTRPGPTLPPGIIRVYGVPQASFDKDFTTLADQLGPKPLAIFGEEDIDRPAYKRRRQLPLEEDDEKEDLQNVPFNSRNPKHPTLESEPVNDGDDDDDDDTETTKKPYKKPSKKNNSNGLASGKPLGGVKGADGDDDDDDDDDDKTGGDKKKKGHSIESVDLYESPFSTSGFYNPAQAHNSPHDFFHQQPAHHQMNHHQKIHPHHHQGGPHHQVGHHHQAGAHHQNVAHHQNAPHQHSGYGYRPMFRPIQIRPSPTRSHLRPGRLYPMYGKK